MVTDAESDKVFHAVKVLEKTSMWTGHPVQEVRKDIVHLRMEQSWRDLEIRQGVCACVRACVCMCVCGGGVPQRLKVGRGLRVGGAPVEWAGPCTRGPVRRKGRGLARPIAVSFPAHCFPSISLDPQPWPQWN